MKYILSSAIKSHLQKRGKIIDRGREISQQIEDLTKEQNKLALQVNKINERVRNIGEKEMKRFPLAEFEYISKYFIESENVVCETVDALAEFKENYKKRIETR